MRILWMQVLSSCWYVSIYHTSCTMWLSLWRTEKQTDSDLGNKEVLFFHRSLDGGRFRVHSTAQWRQKSGCFYCPQHTDVSSWCWLPRSFKMAAVAPMHHDSKSGSEGEEKTKVVVEVFCLVLFLEQLSSSSSKEHKKYSTAVPLGSIIQNQVQWSPFPTGGLERKWPLEGIRAAVTVLPWTEQASVGKKLTGCQAGSLHSSSASTLVLGSQCK